MTQNKNQNILHTLTQINDMAMQCLNFHYQVDLNG